METKRALGDRPSSDPDLVFGAFEERVKRGEDDSRVIVESVGRARILQVYYCNRRLTTLTVAAASSGMSPTAE